MTTLPVTSVRYSTVFVADFAFGIDINVVQEIIRYQNMTPVPLAPAAVSGLINLRGVIVTALDLRQRLGLPPRPAGARPINVVVSVDDQPVSLLVDGIGDVVTTTHPPDKVPDTLSGPARDLILGVYRLDDRLLLVLDAAAATRLNGPGGTPGG
jgi:purine-binding chemotaxis protein CheW